MKPGEIVLLENLRFYLGEEKNSKSFAKKLASYADIFVNDAFSVCHRRHASVVAITEYLPSYVGLLLEKEINNLNKILKPKHPAVAVLGGAKISTKIGVIKNLLKNFDKVLIGGAIANNFIKAAGYEVGRSLVDENCKLNLEKYNFNKLILPVDVVVETRKQKNRKTKKQIKKVKIKDVDELGKGEMILDIGSETIEMFQKEIKKAKTIVWNGPMGFFENKEFARGTDEITEAIFKNKKAQVVIGGGETISALGIINQESKIKNNVFISTGGGAMLKFLEGETLPGIKSLIG